MYIDECGADPGKNRCCCIDTCLHRIARTAKAGDLLTHSTVHMSTRGWRQWVGARYGQYEEKNKTR